MPNASSTPTCASTSLWPTQPATAWSATPWTPSATCSATRCSRSSESPRAPRAPSTSTVPSWPLSGPVTAPKRASPPASTSTAWRPTSMAMSDEAAIMPVDPAGLDPWLQRYREMVTIRMFEERVNELYRSGKMPGLAHLYIGEEAVAVGVCSGLKQDDLITSTHRGHGHCLAKGADIGRMFAELLGKETGYCHGKGGSMHIADHANGNLGANAIVGGSAGIATGAAFAAQRLGTDRVAVCFFGDGALGQGLLYEVMNMAALWKLPVVYVCENNLYNEYTHFSEVTAGSIPGPAEAFGIPAEEVDGQDVLAVRATTERAVARARAGDGPSFLLAATYRYHGHHVGDIDRAYYRKKEEEELWVTERDPIELLAARLGDEEAVAALRARLETEVADAVAYALDAPYPDRSEVTQNVFA